jgi:hypothetical protein
MGMTGPSSPWPVAAVHSSRLTVRTLAGTPTADQLSATIPSIGTSEEPAVVVRVSGARSAPERWTRSRASSGSYRGAISGVCPWSIGGTTPPVTTIRLAGAAAARAARSIA